jgi:hypothetical protein
VPSAIQFSLNAIAFGLLVGLTVVLLSARSELNLAHKRLLGFGLTMADGPLLGQPLSRRARHIIASVVPDRRSRLLVFFVGASCAACRAVLERIRRDGVPDLHGHILVVAVNGDRTLAESLVEHLNESADVCVLVGEEGTQLHDECSIKFTPSVVRVVDGLVYTKGVVSGIGTLREAVRWDEPTEALTASNPNSREAL